MRIPLNWLGEFVKLPKEQKTLTDKLTMAGHMLDKTDKVNGNIVVDLELRGNRADCYSIIGIAREVSALFNVPVKYPKTTLKIKKVKKLDNIELEIKTDLVKRVMMVEVRDVKIMESPKWLKDRLQEYGMATINNIVDLTNYVMIETGEPMHAFDLDKIGNKLEIRLAKNREQMITFLGKSITLDSNDLVWADKKNILSIAGAIGGKIHSIASDTKNILLEAASYDRANIRRSIHKHNLLTDAGIRHEKELDPNIVEVGFLRFLELIEKNKWGRVGKKVSDYYPKQVVPWKLTLNYDYLAILSGITIDRKVVIKILKSLNFEIIKQEKESVEVLAPTYRTDVTLEEDLIEEVLRIYGYEKIPVQTLSLEIPKVTTPDYINQELDIKNQMISLGFDEIISLAFVKESSLDKNKPVDDGNYLAVRVINRPSPDIEELRMSLLPNLMEFNKKIFDERGTESHLFELGKIYLKHKNNYIEKRKLGIIYCQKDGEFVHFKGYLEAFFEKLNIQGVKFEDWENGFRISIKKETIGYGFQFDNVFYVEIDLDSILDKAQKIKAILWPKYPPQIEDITLIIASKTRIGDIVDVIRSSKLISNVELKDIYKDSYTFRVWYQDPNKTLTGEDVEKIRNKYLKEIKEKFGGIVRS